MKELPHHFDKLSAPPEHHSYQLHRKQRTTQIILPMVISVVVLIGMIVLISLATFNSNGDVSRWAAISTIWIVIPILLVGLIVLTILIGLIYLMARALGALPHYTGIAQDYVYIAQNYIIRGADMVVKPMIALEGFIENVKAFFERITTL
jgi:uncharacterized membrane protein (DUF485 family)